MTPSTSDFDFTDLERNVEDFELPQMLDDFGYSHTWPSSTRMYRVRIDVS
jgi:hypothetical protein